MLVPIDGSESALHTLKEVAIISKIDVGKITAIFICSESQGGSSFVMPNLTLGCNDKIVFSEAKKVADTAGITIEAILLEGNASEKILKTAHDGCFDLIVIGARGLSNLSGFILGSISQAVLKNTSCPVLVIH
ncbi:MAG TPA: universal stress protein [Candidatus Acidoferrales bacterium]|nr:universal stress protein [Candidatus Acidoferrales bacterium]